VEFSKRELHGKPESRWFSGRMGHRNRSQTQISSMFYEASNGILLGYPILTPKSLASRRVAATEEVNLLLATFFS